MNVKLNWEKIKNHYIYSTNGNFSGITLILLVAIWLILFFVISNDMIRTKKEAVSNLENVVKSFEAHTEEALNTSDMVLKLLKYHYEKSEISNMNVVSDYFENGVINTSFINQFGIIDRDGKYIYSNIKGATKIDLSDREHFNIHKKLYPYELFISKPVIGRISHKPSIQLTRRINDASGSFNGVAVVSFNPTYFFNFYKKIDLGGNAIYSIIGLDGQPRVLQIGDQSEERNDINTTDIINNLQKADNGVFISGTSFDGKKRLYVYQKMGNQPLAVLIGVELSEIYSDANDRRAAYFITTIALSLFILFTSFIGKNFLKNSAELNKVLLEKNLESEKIMQNQREFLSSVSHELRTPLNGIIGYAEYIHYTSTESLIKFPSQIIFESSLHLLNLVNSLLDLNKIDNNILIIKHNEFNLIETLESICNTHRSRTIQRNLTLIFESDENLPEKVFMDELRLKQVLNNLLDNAIKFSKDTGQIILSAHYIKEVDSIYFSIKDDGIGIPESMHYQVFEDFWQNENFITRAHGGSGIGLHLVQKLVSLMGGKINFNSLPNVGSIFYFTLNANTTSNNYDNSIISR